MARYYPSTPEKLLDEIEDDEAVLQNKKALRTIAMAVLPVPLGLAIICFVATVHAQPGTGGVLAGVIGTVISIIATLLNGVSILTTNDEVWKAEHKVLRSQREYRNYLNGKST